MRKLFLGCAAVLAAGLFQANAADNVSLTAAPAASADYQLVERGVSGKQIGDYTYVFTLVLHMDGKFTVGVEPMPKVYRDDRSGRHEDVTSEVLVDYKIEFNQAEGCIDYSYNCREWQDSWSGSGSLYPLM